MKPIEIAGAQIAPGRKKQIDLPIARMATGSWLHLPLTVVHGARPGPTIWLSGAIHGDELNGIEIVRRLTKALDPKQLVGTVLAVPIVNVFAFLNGSRYTPDRRDLNRSFPGSRRGSLASRIAAQFGREIVARCDWGVDFHTGSDHRSNLPQIRASVDDEQTLTAAKAFAAPAILAAEPRERSLRKYATSRGVRVLLFEGGQSLRFDEPVIRVAVDGTLRVLQQLEMLENAPDFPDAEPRVFMKSRWARAGRGGLAQLTVELGDEVSEHQTIASIAGPTTSRLARVRSARTGCVVGVSLNPIVNQGDAVAHIAYDPL